jgi:hypothetical protein
MRWRLAVLTLLLSISVQSYGALVLPKHDSVTYSRVEVTTNEARKANQRWILIDVRLYGAKVLGKKFLNGTVQFSYDSHFMGDRADLGLRVSNSSNVAGSISKAVSRGGYKQHKRDWGTNMYVGGAKWGRQSNISQFLYGAKENSEQDYVMLAWMLANANDIIEYAVENDTKMSSKAKTGWNRLRDFTRAAYGNVNNVKTILAQADEKTPSSASAQLVKTESTKELQYKNDSLTFQIKQLNKRIVSLRDDNKKLLAKAASVSKKSSRVLVSKYRMFIQRLEGSNKQSLGYLTLVLDNGKIATQNTTDTFIRDHVPSRVVGTYLDNGDFELLITANIIRKYTYNERTDLLVKGNLFNPRSISTEDKYSRYGFTAQAFMDKKGVPIDKIKGSPGCYYYNNMIFKKRSANDMCTFRSIYISEAEMESKKLSSANSKTIAKIINNDKKISAQQRQIISLTAKVKKATSKKTQSTSDEVLKKNNDQLTLEVVSLKEQVADLNSKLRSGSLPANDADAIALNFCVSTKLKHIYVVASNDSCVKPYIEMERASVVGFSQASGIKHVTTLPWISIKSLTSAQVKKIQYLLVYEGFSTLEPDGLIGPNTIKAMQALLSKKGDEQSKKIASSQLYLQQNTLNLLLQNAQQAEVKQLHKKTIESRDLISKRDTQINLLSTQVNSLLESTSGERKDSATAYKLSISKLNEQIANLQQQVVDSQGEASSAQQNLLSKSADARQLTSSLAISTKTIAAKDAEIKSLTNELAVATEKSKKNQTSDSSFMETLSEEWRPLIVDMPLTERLFCDLYHDFNISKENAEASNNQIRVNLVHRSFQEDLDSLLPGGSLDQWIVKVLKVSQISNGDAAIIAELPCGVLVGSGTMSSEEGSSDELSWAATIPYSSRLYSELAKVSIGDFVNVSGTFVQIEAFKSGRNETFYASNSIGKNPLVAELGLDKDLYLLDLAYFMMLR